MDVRTFHSLGYSILGINGDGKEVPEYEISDLIKNYFKESISKNSTLIKEIIEFFCYYYNIVYMNMDNIRFETFKSRLTTLNEYDEYLSEYLHVDNVKKSKEYMTNIKDLVVANYLFIHNIKYEYLKQAIFKIKYYDNYISNYNNFLFSNLSSKIPDNIKLELIDELHENFGYTSFNNYPNFYLPDEDVYIDLTSCAHDWEDNINEEISSKLKFYKTKLLTIFDHDNDIHSLLNEIETKLTDLNVDIENVNYELFFEKLIKQDTLPEYARFIQTVQTFINLFKGNAQNIDDNGEDISKEMFKIFINENHQKYSNSIEKRNEFFLKIIEKIYDLYTENLKGRYIDFNDMINDAVVYLRNGVSIHKYKYIIVDEYQDTSYTRYNLLKEVQNVTNAKVMVVGDDWQSIYGFTGCDVNLFAQFDKYFENPDMVKINVTRRNSQELIDIIGEFIQKNKNQIPKKLISDKSNDKPIKIFKYVSRGEEVLALIKVLDRISQEKEDAHILILGRNNYDIYEIACRGIFELTQFKDFTNVDYDIKPDLNIEFRTVHKSKGLQADYVIVLNLNNQINGFPNKIIDDPVLYFVNNKHDENIDYPEERRLFYVALTRTKNDVYLFGKYKRPSEFMEEIIDKKGVELLDYSFSNDEIIYINQLLQKRFEVIETDVVCPKCRKGIVNLIVNNDKGTSYFRCSNFCGWEGSSYHNKNNDDGVRKIAYVKYVKACPIEKCQGIHIVKRNSNDGRLFLGCTSYKTCTSRTTSLSLADEDINNLVLDVNLIKTKKTRFGVYYLGKYIPEDKRDDYNFNDVNFSKSLIGFKNGNENDVDLFTQDLMEFISNISNEKFENKSQLALIAVPSSKAHKINSSIKKSIDIIEESYQKGELESEFNCDKEIINCKNLLKRVTDVPTAHKGEGRATCSQHIESMKCMKEKLPNKNIVYIVLDDITTTGNTMMACNELLLDAGVKNENIYNIALGATVRDDDEEI